MRVMDLPPFSKKIEIPDLEYFIKTRLNNRTLVMWPNQAIPLLGYMCHPADEAARKNLMDILRGWDDPSGTGQHPFPAELNRIQAEWIKVADIFQNYCDLIEGKHQARRGGPSISKSVTLVAANAEIRGTGHANLWKVWADYKDVAHLVTSAALICSEVRSKFGNLRPGPAGLSPTLFTCFQMAFRMLDLLLSVAKNFEAYGLRVIEARPQPAFDPDTVWRIPTDINVSPVPPPIRKLRQQDIVVLKNRRAGNRGKTHKTD
jgi:hypothetical protein